MSSPEADYQKFKFSASVKTTDRAVLTCLRALCQDAETHPKKQIGWGGSGVEQWMKDGHIIRLRFTSVPNRDRFIENAKRVLGEQWSLVRTSDADPATRQRAL